ncbi:MAG: hypothetical protein PWQ08_952 [Clostridiales bacterium]|nr:hypothetical protein [Clostridiales bacterium]
MGVFSEMSMEMNQWDLETPMPDREIQPFDLEPPAEDTAAAEQEVFDDEAAQQAEADNAPAMEHIISDETLSHLILYFRNERLNESNPVCPVCHYENKEQKCTFTQDGHCRAC